MRQKIWVYQSHKNDTSSLCLCECSIKLNSHFEFSRLDTKLKWTLHQKYSTINIFRIVAFLSFLVSFPLTKIKWSNEIKAMTLTNTNYHKSSTILHSFSFGSFLLSQWKKHCWGHRFLNLFVVKLWNKEYKNRVNKGVHSLFIITAN